MSNPFDGNNPFGGAGLGGLMAGFQQQMQQVQAQAASTVVMGEAGGGLVKVYSGVPLRLTANRLAFPAATGGSQTLSVFTETSTGPNQFWWVFGSLSGTASRSGLYDGGA